MDALERGALADVVALPGSTREVAAIVLACHETRTPIVPRGGGTGFTGGAVPVHGGVVLSLERMNRIVEIDEASLVAVVEPHVITGDLQDAVERVGLFYPPDPSSLRRSVIGGNVAECAGGPRAFKYGVTRHYVLGTEAVLPTGEVIRTGGRVVKNVVGYDLTQLLVGSEGTLAILTEVTLRLVPKPPAAATLRATFATIRHAVDAAARIIQARVVPASLELIDRDSLEAVAAYVGRRLAPPETGALLLVEVDGLAEQVAAEADRVEAACRAAGATELLRATTDEERQDLWRVRREISPSLLGIASRKINHDIVVPKGRIPELFDLVGGAEGAIQHADSGVRPRRRRQHPREFHDRWRGCRRRSPGSGGGRGALPRRRRARRRDQRGARHRVHQGEVSGPRAVGRDHRAHETRQARVRSARHSQSGQDLSGIGPPVRRVQVVI